MVVFLVVIAFFYSGASREMGQVKAADLTKSMKTVCAGRFLVDVPTAMDVSYGAIFVAGFWVSTVAEGPEAFAARIAGRELELGKLVNDRGARSLEKVTPFESNGLAGKIFTFGRTSVKGFVKRKPVQYVNVALEAYVHSAGTTFELKATSVDSERSEQLAEVVSKLRVVPENELPAGAGFCFGRAMLVDPVPVEWTEGLGLFAGFKAQPDVALALRTRAGVAQDGEPGRLARNAAADAEMPLWQKSRLKKIRVGARAINGIEGEEVMERGTEKNSVNVFLFDWEAAGSSNDVSKPTLHLELSTGHSAKGGAPPVPSFLAEDDLVELWDKISGSIRLRPVQETPQAAQDVRQGPEPGETSVAGAPCPETGWWRCDSVANGVRVYGGRRQYFHKGQPMPQALLLPPQSIWEKLRGLQPSFEEKDPTVWLLADRRALQREAPVDLLAPPAAAGLSSLEAKASGGAAPVAPGSYVRTGAACPATGWWQCQDSDALDAARWFASGELLPSATFQVAPGRGRLARREVQTIQRRTVWQFVRADIPPKD